MEKAVKSEIKLGLPFMVPNLVYKFQMICLWGTYVIKRQPNMGICKYTWDMGKHLMHNNSPSFLTVKWLFPAKSYKHEILKRKQRKSDFWSFDLGELIKKDSKQIKPQFWACPKLTPRFLMPYIMVFYLCLIGLRWKVIVHFVDIDGMVDPSLFKLSIHYLILILIRYC